MDDQHRTCDRCLGVAERDATQDSGECAGYRCQQHGGFRVGLNGSAVWPQSWRPMTEEELRTRDYSTQLDILAEIRK
jgi:hypothetical protein